MVVRVVLPLEGDALAVEGTEPVIADRDAMRVAPQVAQHGGRSPEGGLRVHDPVGLEERVDEGVPPSRIPEVLGGAGQFEFMPRVGPS